MTADRVVSEWLNVAATRPASTDLSPEAAECLRAFNEYTAQLRAPRRFGRMRSLLERITKP